MSLLRNVSNASRAAKRVGRAAGVPRRVVVRALRGPYSTFAWSAGFAGLIGANAVRNARVAREAFQAARRVPSQRLKYGAIAGFSGLLAYGSAKYAYRSTKSAIRAVGRMGPVQATGRGVRAVGRGVRGAFAKGHAFFGNQYIKLGRSGRSRGRMSVRGRGRR